MKVKSFSIKAPISVNLGKSKPKKYYLNLNLLRNQVAHLNNNIKQEYKRIVVPLIPDVYYEQFKITYTLYLPDNRLRDISNVLSICDKNFCDAFVEAGHAPDDNFNYLKEVVYKFGGFDENKEGYVIIEVEEV